MKKLIQSLAIGALCLSTTLFAQEGDFATSLNDIQRSWAVANYEQQDKAQVAAFEELLASAESLTNSHSNKAEAWIWKGIIESSFAGAKGGLGALSLAKDAKKSFEKAMDIDADALMGSAYTSLGTLYHKVPGWPIGFGSDKKAKQLLSKALDTNPEGIDSNYFYGEFLFDEGKYSDALAHLEKAQNAPARADRPLADKYRHQEIEALLAKVNKKLKK